MRDLTSPTWIKIKGLLFLLTGSLAAVLLLIEHPTLKSAVLMGLTVWCFCRFYYFAFYVIEHYVDPSFKFAGLWDFGLYLLRRQKSLTTTDQTHEN